MATAETLEIREASDPEAVIGGVLALWLDDSDQVEALEHVETDTLPPARLNVIFRARVGFAPSAAIARVGGEKPTLWDGNSPRTLRGRTRGEKPTQPRSPSLQAVEVQTARSGAGI